ncbi:MAG: MFS transporter [Actinomycetota bacterium]
MQDASISSNAADGANDDRLLTPHFALVTAAALAVFIGFGATIPLLPRFIEQEFGDGPTTIGVVFGTISLSAIVIRPFAARWGDTLGRRFLIVTGAAIVAVGVALHATAVSSEMLVPFRLVMGAGQGMLFVGAATLVNDLAPPHRRGEATSYFSVAVYGGLGVGPLIGELLLDAVGFTTAWLLAAGFVAAGVVIALRLPARIGVPERPPAPPTGPLRDRLAHPAGIGPGLVLMLGVMPYAAFASYVPGVADEAGLGDAGTIFAVYAATVLTVRLLGARLPDRLGLRVTGTAALTTIGLGMLLLATLQTPIGLHLAAMVYAVGQSLLYPALFAAAVNSVGDDERSRVVATFTMFFDISNGVGGLVLGLAAGAAGRSGAFLFAAVLAMMGLVALQSLLADRRSSRPATLSPSAGN